MSFDGLAPHYRWLEFLLAGEKLQRCRTAFLAEAFSPGRILILGEGNGRFLAECRRRYPQAQITCLDASAGMLSQARARLLRSGPDTAETHFIHSNVLTFAPPQAAFDLVVTHFVLDCFPPEELERVVQKLAAACAPDGAWWIADFRIPAAGPTRWRAEAIHWLMYSFFRIVTRLPASRWTAPDRLLRAYGFVLCQRRVSEWGLLHADQWQRSPAVAARRNIEV